MRLNYLTFIIIGHLISSIAVAQTFTSSNLPIVVINTNNVPIPDEPKISADMGIIYNGPGNRNYLTDPFNEYNGKIAIEKRGSSSQMFPKKQYGLETRDTLGIKVNVSIFGWPSEHDWILYAPYSDKALIRNVLAYKLGWETGHYAPRTKLCELVLNNEYMGVYVFMEKIKIDAGRVDIAKLTHIDTSGYELTGGYLLKIDKLTGGGSGWYSPFDPIPAANNQKIYIQYHDPDPDSLLPVQKSYIRDYITQYESVLSSPNYNDQTTGYPAYINIYSFIDYLIVNEVSKNVDGYRLSTFFYKDKYTKDPRIYVGPLWDFNLAFGNANYCGGGNANDGWALDFNTVCSNDGWQIPFWWDRLLQDTTFQNKLKCRWEELREGPLYTDTLLNWIDSTTVYLDESQQRNFIRWPILSTYVWPNNFVGGSYQAEIDYMKTWISDRLNWLDANIPGTCYPWTSSNDNDLLLSHILIYPNPISEESVLFFNLEHTAKLNLNVYNVFGQMVKRINVGQCIEGSNFISLREIFTSIVAGTYIIQLELAGKKPLVIRIVKL